MRYGSVCSGIEAASVAWHPLGWRPAFFSEIEAFPRAVLQHRFPDVPLHGDFTTIKADEYGPIDLLVGGTPCQSFSIAGLRGGLDDDRGNLALEFLRLADRTRPRWLVWENVPGVLSSNGGRDFGSILGGLGQLGYGWAYRVLDAQFFGVAQRRRRVFVVGHLGDWRRAAAVLFERHSLSGHPAPRREAGEGIAQCLTTGTGKRFDPETETLPIAFSKGDHGADAGVNVSPTIRKGGDGGGNMPAIAFDTTQITSPNNFSNPKLGDACHPLAAGAHPPAVAWSIMPMNSGKDYNARPTNVAQPIMAGGPVGGNQGGDFIVQAFAQNTRDEVRLVEGEGDPAFTLQAGHSHAVAYDMRGREGGAQFEGPHDTANIRAASGGSSRSYVAVSAVRRLTPVECERLQGFPDNFTSIPWRGKPADNCPDGPRYKALGNSMAVPVMRWIGERIAMVDAISAMERLRLSPHCFGVKPDLFSEVAA